MIPCRLDLPTWRNADYAEAFPVLDGSKPVDLTGLVFRGEIRRYAGDATALLILDMAADMAEGIYISNAVGGEFEITIKRETLDNLHSQVANDDEVATLSFDLLILYADDFRETWAQGVLMINPGVAHND